MDHNDKKIRWISRNLSVMLKRRVSLALSNEYIKKPYRSAYHVKNNCSITTILISGSLRTFG